MIMSKLIKIRQPLSQMAVVFSVIGLVFGLFTSAGFWGFFVTACCALIPLIIGPRRYRIYGAVALSVGAVGAGMLYHDYQKDPYFVRAKVGRAFQIGAEYKAAAEDYWSRNHGWPGKIADLGLKKPSEAIKSVTMESNGIIRIVLSFPPLKDKSLAFIPSVNGNVIHWRCSGGDIPDIYLPAGCKKK